MGTSRLKKTHFDFFLAFMHVFLCRNMFPIVHSFWVFLSKFIVHVFGSIIGHFFRFPTNRYLQEIGSGDCLNSNFDHVDQGNREEESSSMVSSTSKYEFLCRNGISGYIEEPKTASFTVHELYMGSNDHGKGGTIDSGDPADGDVRKIEVEKVEKPVEEKAESSYAVFEDKTEESALRFSFSIGFEKQIEQEQPVEAKFICEQKTEDFDEQKGDDSVENFMVEKLLEKPKKEIETEDIFEEKAEESVENHILEKILVKHVSDMDGNDHHVKEKFWEFFESPASALASENQLPSDGQEVENMEQEIHEQETSFSDQDAAIIRGPIDDSDDEFIELEPLSEKFSVTQPDKDSSIEDEPTLQEQEGDDDYSEEEEDDDYSEEDDDDSEPDELIERLKMELKMARTGGLPTILEESDSPKMVQELGPLQIDEKFDHKDHVAEIRKVYKSYSDKMRKLDILNSQTMHAISLLQLKDTVRASTSGKSSAPAMKSILSHKVVLVKQRKYEADPAMKLVSELCKDFETVYVGQVCLSWEILHWQFGKVKQLFECDRHGVRQYNQVAGEFQRFQVLVQRFLEDEPFKARSRVENYVKNRCSLRHFLQVPVIKDDCSKYKNGDQEYAVSSEMLIDIIEESMYVFWEFLRADKEEAKATSKVPQQAQVAPHDPIDLELLKDVRTDLQKKEKRLKEIQRSTNCIIKKFHRQHQGNLLDHALFIAQVEVRLVSRVLNMVKITTDQLVWCHEKLQKINFSNRKIEIEPSFSLFPC